MTVIGLEVPHVHVHLIPLKEMSDMDFRKKLEFSPEKFEEIQNQIQKYFE